MDYLPRVVDSMLDSRLRSMGGVLIEGPRGCGKTATGMQRAQSFVRFDQSPQLVQLVDLNPGIVLAGEVPRLLDEWQLAPNIWNVARHAIDDRQARGQFIFSGSASPPPDRARHSGAGRIARMRMRPMTLTERHPGSAAVSLATLHAGQDRVSAHSDLSYQQLAQETIRGGWPGLIGESDEAAMDFNTAYCDELCQVDIPMAAGVMHDPVRVRRLLSALARHISGDATLRSLAEDVAGDGAEFATTTARTYMDGLTQVFVLEEFPAWFASLRSKSRLRTRSKINFSEPALACAALGTDADRLAADPEYFGQVFESMAIRDLRVYAEAERGRVFYYRDNTDLEVDAILEYGYKDWAAVEVKLGWVHIPDAEQHLLKLRDERIDTAKMGPPAFLAVITGTEYAYTLPSGVHVVPLATLTA